MMVYIMHAALHLFYDGFVGEGLLDGARKSCARMMTVANDIGIYIGLFVYFGDELGNALLIFFV